MCVKQTNKSKAALFFLMALIQSHPTEFEEFRTAAGRRGCVVTNLFVIPLVRRALHPNGARFSIICALLSRRFVIRIQIKQSNILILFSPDAELNFQLFLAATSGIFRPFICTRRFYLQAHAPLFNQAPSSVPSNEAPASVAADLESQTVVAPDGGVVESKLPSGHIPGRFAIVYTCEVCQLRSAKTFSKHSYMKGVVLIRCDGCDKLHLIADNLVCNRLGNIPSGPLIHFPFVVLAGLVRSWQEYRRDLQCDGSQTIQA
jgi:hypothetical protein